MSRFVSIAEAREQPGLRMACLRKIPSPWTEAAKGIFRVKGLECQYAAESEQERGAAIAAWAGDSSIPVVAFEKEPLRTGWAEILILAERLAPKPALIPSKPAARARMFGLANEICGEMGLGWCVRLLIIRDSLGHSGRQGGQGAAAGRLAVKYGFNPTHVSRAEDRAVEILLLLAAELGDQTCFIDDRLTALDIYWATMANLLTPLDEDKLPMAPSMRRVYATDNERLLEALSPALRQHQQRTYETHLELPVPL